jgi:hypothetical protein
VVIVALPFALLAAFALAGLLTGRLLELVWLIQAILTVEAWREELGSSSSTAGLAFLVPLIVGPVIAMAFVVGSSLWRALGTLRHRGA